MSNVYRSAALTGILAVTFSQFAGIDAASAEQIADGARAVVVRYDDLDLTREAGREVLRSRLENAAERACGSYDPHNTRARQSWKDCVAAALTAAFEEFPGTQPASLQSANVD